MRKILQKSKKAQGQIIGVILIILLAIAVIGGGIFMYSTRGETSTQSTIQQASVIAQASKSGDVASIGVYVRDLSNDDVNTKMVVPVYCMGDDGTFIIDGTSSSSTAEITGKTTVGTIVSCYAFNATTQTMSPTIINVDDEVEHILVDAYKIPIAANLDIYDETFTVSDDGASNISLTSAGSDTYQKFKFTNNDTDKFFPLAGFYINTVENTNISRIDFVGSATVGGISGKSSTNIIASNLNTRVSTRKTKWDHVFEIDDSDTVVGNDGVNPIILDESDFIESGIITVESDTALACTGTTTGDVATWYAFTKGYFRETQNTGIGYGHENDAIAAAVISVDPPLDTFICATT